MAELLDKLHYYRWGILLAAIVLYLPVRLYLYMPFKARARQVRPRVPEHQPSDASQLPRELAATFQFAGGQLQRLGFALVGYVAHRVAATQQTGHIALWSNAAMRDSAQIIAVRTPDPLKPGTMRTTALVTYRTDFTDEKLIATTNTRTPGVFPADPDADSIVCAGIDDLELLYRVHRARVDRWGARRTATLERVGDAVACLADEHKTMFERLSRFGYYELDPTGQTYRLTIKGGFLTVWRLLPPWRQIRRVLRRRKANQVLRELGFGSLDELAGQQRAVPIAIS